MFERSYISSPSTGGYWQCSSSISWLHFDIVESKCWLEMYVCFNLLEVYFSLTQFMLGAALVAREMTLPFSKNKFITFAWHWRDVFTLFLSPSFSATSLSLLILMRYTCTTRNWVLCNGENHCNKPKNKIK